MATTKQAMPLWSVLRCEEGSAITVPDEATALDALVELLEQEYGGGAAEYLASDIVRYEARHRVEMGVWYSCRKAYREERCEDPDMDWYAPDGDGARFIQVAWFPGNIYSLGERIEEALGGD